jgi:hypothetical protein
MSGLLSGSATGKLGAAAGVPLVAAGVGGIALVVGIVVVRDSWNHRIVLGRDGLSVTDGLGRYVVPYRSITSVIRRRTAVVARSRRVQRSAARANEERMTQ